MSAMLQSPPLDGSTTVLPGLLDFHAEHNPDLPWAVYPSSDTMSSISFLEYAQATHRVAHILRPNGSVGGRDVVVMLIHCDTLLYVTMLMGIGRAGMVPFPVSPRNSPEAITNLLIKTSCCRVVTQPSLIHLLSDAQTAFAARGACLQVDELPSINVVYPSLSGVAQNLEEVPFPAIEKPSDDDIALYLHSAGSTGLPKPIALSQKIINQWVNNPLFTGSRDHRVRWAAMALPTFHSMGILTQIMAPLVSGQPVAVYEPKYPAPPVIPNPQNLLDATRICGCNAVMTVPSFIEIWAESEESVKFMASLKMVFFGGGPLSAENGSKLTAQGVILVSGYGATEAGPVCHPFDGFEADPSDPNSRTLEDWQWQRISPLTIPRWVPQGDGTYELQFLTCEAHQPSVENLPDVKGYATSDLWEPHPTKKGLWRIVGRKDDVIVLGSGEKIVPIPQERYIASHPLVTDAVMFGRAKPQAGILIDPVPEHAIDPKDEAAVTKFIDEIWPYIEQANEDAPTFARIFKEMVLITDPAKPLPRAAKGNIVRKYALDLYADAIERLYDADNSNMDSKTVSCPVAWDATEVESWLLSLTASVNHGYPLQPTIDIFEQGFDSLHATFVRNHIVNALKASANQDIQSAAKFIDQNIVYANPMIKTLAAAVASVVLTKAASSHAANQARLIDELVRKYSASLPVFPQAPEAPQDGRVVFLTGSTGSIGSYILASLLADPRVTRVYAFNRPSRTPTDRQLASFEARGLPAELLRRSKYVPISGDLSEDDFGLIKDVAREISSSVTHIVHNGWRVDFNHALGSFETQIAGTRKLVDFSASTGRHVRMLFTSSVGVAHSWPAENGLVPETPLSDPGLASDSGYSASKYVVEQILSKAHGNGFEVTSLRVGQVCGSDASGAWNVTDWVPILVKSALSMGCLPDLDEPVTWIPVDAVASCFIDLMFSAKALPPLVNLLHPRPISWKHIVDAIAEELKVSWPLIPLDDWLLKVSALADNATPEDMEKIPAIKLLGFFRTLSTQPGARPVFDTKKLQEVSDTMRILEPIGAGHARMWASYWRSQGFL